VVISDDLCHRAFSYASKKDPVHLGEDLYTYFQRTFSDESQQQEPLQQLLDSKEKLILLDPHPDAKGIDHDYEGKTFSKILKDHIEAYLGK
jgi:hypothetical protein